MMIFFYIGPGEHPISLHPLHLHGHFFRVVAMKKLKGNVTVDQVKQLDKDGKIQRRLDRAPLKDTIKTPDGGYTIVRFFTGNPGKKKTHLMIFFLCTRYMFIIFFFVRILVLSLPL